MNTEQTTIRAERSPRYGRNLQLWVQQGNRIADIALRPENPMDEWTHVPPTISLTPNEAQILMDDLYSAGIRPTEAAGSAGAMAATQKHLSDVRAIAFHQLKITPP